MLKNIFNHLFLVIGPLSKARRKLLFFRKHLIKLTTFAADSIEMYIVYGQGNFIKLIEN